MCLKSCYSLKITASCACSTSTTSSRMMLRPSSIPKVRSHPQRSLLVRKNSYSASFIISRDQLLQLRSKGPLPRDDSKKGPQSAESHRDRLLPSQSMQGSLQSQVWVDQFPERSCRANQENHQVLHQASQFNGNVLLNCILSINKFIVSQRKISYNRRTF